MKAKKRKLSHPDDSGVANDASNDTNHCGSNIPIHTLCVGPINAEMTSDQIKSYFEQFGRVNSVKMFALVEFNDIKGAAAVLSSSNEMHKIDGCDVQVEVAEPSQQPDNILNALDDDCLRMVLSGLNQADLKNAANVCNRFKRQANSVFAAKFKKLDLTNCTHDKMKNSLKTFGSSALSIDVKSRHPKNANDAETFTMIAKCCTPVLKELTFHNFSFLNPSLKNIKFNSALRRVERLSFYDCDIRNQLINLLSACPELKALHFNRCHRISIPKLIWRKFSKLEELRLNDYYGNCNWCLHEIISMNPTITKLSLLLSLRGNSAVYSKNPSETIRKIVQHIPNLRELELNFLDSDFTKTVRFLGQLKSLKVLQVEMNWKSIELLSTVLVTNDIPIERMQITEGTINTEAINNMSQMKHLKVLKFSNIKQMTDEQMIVLAKCLGSQLEKLQLDRRTAQNLTTIGLKKMLPFATKLSLLTLESNIDF